MSGIEHLTKCFNCNKPYDVAKLLPCGHSICSQCEQANQVIDCARFKENHNCAQVHKLRSDENDGAQLPTNHSVMQLMKLLNNPVNAKSLRDSVDKKLINETLVGAQLNRGSAGNTNNSNLVANSNMLSSHGASHGLKSILKHHTTSNNNNNKDTNIHNNSNFDMSEKSALLDNLHHIKEKLDTLMTNYLNGKRLIDAEYKQIASEIDKAYQIHTAHLAERKNQLIESIEERKLEVMRDYERRKEDNKNAKEFLEEIRQEYEHIVIELESKDEPIQPTRLKELNEQLKLMIVRLNQNSHLIPLEPKKKIGRAHV